MSSAARYALRALTALLMSIAVGWGPTAFSAVGAVAQQAAITLSPAEGAPGTPVHLSFPSCKSPLYRIGDISWETIGSIGFTPSEGGADFRVPDQATERSYRVTATCVPGPQAVGGGTTSGSATFTVTATHSARQDITLDPASGPAGTAVTVSGIGFNCSAVSVSWDDGSTLARVTPSSEGDISGEFVVPEDAAATTHPVEAVCTDYPSYRAATDFTVTATETETNGTTTGGGNTGGTNSGGTENGGTENGGTENGGTENGGTESGGTTGDTTNGGTTGDTGDTGDNTNGGIVGSDGGTDSGGAGEPGGGGGGSAVPVGWVVGPSVFAALLLLALLFSLASHRQRGPRWVRDHVRTALRPAAATASLLQRRDGGSADRTVRLEPHPDPGDQRLDHRRPPSR